MTVSLFFQTLIDGIMIGGVYATIAVGLSLAFGVMRIVNWAHGEFLMVGMYLAFLSVMELGIDPYLSILITGPVLFLAGFFLQKFVFNRMLAKDSSREPLSILLFTSGMGIFLSNMATVLFSSNIMATQTAYTSRTIKLGEIIVSIPRMISFFIAIALACTLALYIVIQRTEFGLALRATAQNRHVASLMGINHKTIYSLALGIGLALVGISGSLLVPNSAVSPTVGSSYGTKCFIIVVLGGKGSVPGALLGGIIVGLIEKFGGILWTDAYASLLVFVLFILMLLFRPSGLLGRETS